MHLFNINPKYRRSVVEGIATASLRGPWEIMPEEPGSDREQLWVHDTSDAFKLRFYVRWDAITPVVGAFH
jgi:hypothetical protein